MNRGPIAFLKGIDENTGRKKYYLLYTITFALAAGLAFFWFIIKGKTFIWELDGYEQHYTALAYYGRYLRGIISNIFSGQGLSVPDFDFAISEGSDIINTLNYYVIGEPLNLLSVFVPTDYTYILFNVLSILRLYLAGIAFSELCFGTAKCHRFGVLAGAVSYVFCYWSLLNAARHPFFLTPLIYLPLLILGIEKVLKKQRPYLLIGAVALAGLSNFYFFYMLVLLVVCYCVFRAVKLYGKNVKQWLQAIVRVLIPSVCGALIAGILLFPVLSFFLADNRMAVGFKAYLLYPLSYYSMLPSALLTAKAEFWLAMGYTAPVLLAAFLLFMRKGNRLLKALFIGGITVILFPVFGQFFNAFSYRCNRWSFAFALICCYILATMWEGFLHLTKKEGKLLIICGGAYFALCMICQRSRDIVTFAACGLLLIGAIILFLDRLPIALKELLLIAVLLTGIAFNAYWKYASVNNNYVSEMISSKEAGRSLHANEAAAVKELSDESFVRYSSRDGNRNAGCLAGLSSTGYYWSLANPDLVSFRQELELNNSVGIMYYGYDTRPGLLALSSTNYFVVGAEDKGPIPYGFEKAGTFEGYEVYKNKYALPLGYCYDSVISGDKWKSMSSFEKEEAMLSAVYLGDGKASLAEADVKATSERLAFTPQFDSSEMSFDAGTVTCKVKNAKLTLKLLSPEDCQLYLQVRDLDFEADTSDAGASDDEITSVTIKAASSNKIKGNLVYRTKDDIHYSGNDSFIVDLGYNEKPVKSITVTFTKTGVYSFTELAAIAVPMKSFSDRVELRRENCLKDIRLGEDSLTGSLSLDRNELLCLSIPYSKGWTAYIDGQEVPVVKANLHHLAVEVPAGEHELEFCYSTPNKLAGALISLAGIAMLAAIIIVFERRKKADACQPQKTDVSRG